MHQGLEQVEDISPIQKYISSRLESGLKQCILPATRPPRRRSRRRLPILQLRTLGRHLLINSSVSFAIWSDGALISDELRTQLIILGQSAESIIADQDAAADCLIIIQKNSALPHPATWLRHANQAKATIFVSTGRSILSRSTVPVDATLNWTGEIRELPGIAQSLVSVARDIVNCIPDLPRIFGVRDDLEMESCESEDDLELILRIGNNRLIPARDRLLQEFRRREQAGGRRHYYWPELSSGHSNTGVELLQSSDSGFLAPARTRRPQPIAHSIDILHDPRTTSLVTLVGEPGAGKTLQMRHLDAQSALSAIRDPTNSDILQTFYLPLFDIRQTPIFQSRGWRKDGTESSTLTAGAHSRTLSQTAALSCSTAITKLGRGACAWRSGCSPGEQSSPMCLHVVHGALWLHVGLVIS